MKAVKTLFTIDPVGMSVAIIIIICIAFFIYRRKKGILAKAALCAVSKVEDIWTSSTGKIKFAEVYTYLKKEYPILTLFLTEDDLNQIIEEALLEMKAILLRKKADNPDSTLLNTDNKDEV